MRISIPYDRACLTADLPASQVRAILTPHPKQRPDLPEPDLVKEALAAPIGSKRLGELAADARHVLILASDHTRPVPSRLLLPPILQEIRSANPQAEIHILIATGCHRGPTQQELVEKFGPQIVEKERILIHDAEDRAQMVYKGRLPSGGELWLNNQVDWADLIVAEGFIEPHFFAGFSGGRKSVLPGIAARGSVHANHCAAFIAHPKARAGRLDGNPIHRDMVFAAQAAGLKFILNVVLDGNKRVLAAFAGDAVAAHEAGCALAYRQAQVGRVPADVVVTSNGGYPLDQNIYQCVKGMTAAEACVRPGGVIILCAGCVDGHGGEAFYQWFNQAASARQVAERIAHIPMEETKVDQWQAQILARVLLRARVILVCDPAQQDVVRNMGMQFADSLPSALTQAYALASGRETVVIPDGVGVIVQDLLEEMEGLEE